MQLDKSLNLSRKKRRFEDSEDMLRILAMVLESRKVIFIRYLNNINQIWACKRPRNTCGGEYVPSSRYCLFPSFFSDLSIHYPLHMIVRQSARELVRVSSAAQDWYKLTLRVNFLSSLCYNDINFVLTFFIILPSLSPRLPIPRFSFPPLFHLSPSSLLGPSSHLPPLFLSLHFPLSPSPSLALARLRELFSSFSQLIDLRANDVQVRLYAPISAHLNVLGK